MKPCIASAVGRSAGALRADSLGEGLGDGAGRAGRRLRRGGAAGRRLRRGVAGGVVPAGAVAQGGPRDDSDQQEHGRRHEPGGHTRTSAAPARTPGSRASRRTGGRSAPGSRRGARRWSAAGSSWGPPGRSARARPAPGAAPCRPARRAGSRGPAPSTSGPRARGSSCASSSGASQPASAQARRAPRARSGRARPSGCRRRRTAAGPPARGRAWRPSDQTSLASVACWPGGDLGGEVGRGAGDQPGLGERGVGLGAGDAEVGELHLARAG